MAIKLIAGLGNPGRKHARDRHNAGFWFVDLLAKEHRGSFSRERKLQGESAEIAIAGKRIRLLKPTTYMNLSGQSVGAALCALGRLSRAVGFWQAQVLGQPGPGHAAWGPRDVFGRPCRVDVPAVWAAAWIEPTMPVSGANTPITAQRTSSFSPSSGNRHA